MSVLRRERTCCDVVALILRLVLTATLQISQSDLQRSARDLGPTHLGIFRQHGGRLRILNIELNDPNDAVFNLNVSHWFHLLRACYVKMFPLRVRTSTARPVPR
ncbi:MAG: hypothetical protein LZF60_50143 [Nitrospira sp.]|nr:MAG: hypothetical protein LZF60_50143 [Nitrospira sp.]